MLYYLAHKYKLDQKEIHNFKQNYLNALLFLSFIDNNKATALKAKQEVDRLTLRQRILFLSSQNLINNQILK